MKIEVQANVTSRIEMWLTWPMSELSWEGGKAEVLHSGGSVHVWLELDGHEDKIRLQIPVKSILSALLDDFDGIQAEAVQVAAIEQKLKDENDGVLRSKDVTPALEELRS